MEDSMTVLEAVQKRLKMTTNDIDLADKRQYVSWVGQYKEILVALGIPLHMPMDDLTHLIEMWKETRDEFRL